MGVTIEVPTSYHSDYSEDNVRFEDGRLNIVINYNGFKIEITKEDFAKVADVLCD
ncbi:hypothetical protein P4284_22785 [Bacillus swezeyi]|uniref:hypothetical protein n=1 Tax=Bacillus swezeyi TaxID=1925020 RepID=UPI002E1A8CA6|nr:hypothetical protein [Bacillus swezeyi]MED2979490.1 hypothetical protein [Bacillus swezeyi]